MVRSVGLYIRRLLPVAVVLATASCAVRLPAAPAPAASGTPSATAAPAKSAAPGGGNATRPPGAIAVISGVVRAGPACPVDRVYHACRPGPLGDVEVQARSSSAGVMASARTGADGHYSLQLGPGRYLLVVLTTQVFTSCPHVLVSAESGVAIRADFNCDTGMRHPEPTATSPPGTM